MTPPAPIEARPITDRAAAPRAGAGLARHPVVVSAVAVLVAGMLVWFRLPPTAWDTLWAEDGRTFLAGAEQHGAFGALFVPYAGYLHVVPRLVAGAVVAALPVPLWAYGMTAGACLVTGGVAVLVYRCSGAVVRTPLLRVLLAAVTVLVPLGPRDVLGNPTNLHSVLMWGLFWVLLARPAGRRRAVALSVVGLVCALTEIQSVFLVPLMVLVARRRPGRLLVLGPAAGVAAQLVATLVSPRSAAHHAADSIGSLGLGYLVNAVLPNVVADRLVGPVVAHGGWILACGLLLAVAAFATVAVRDGSPVQRTAIVGAAVLSPLVYVASVVVNPTAYANYAALTAEQLERAWLTRYGVVPGMLLLGIVVVSVDVVWRRMRREDRAGRSGALGRTTAIIAAVAVAACLALGYTPSTTRRSDGPRWSPQIAAAAERCEAAPAGTVLHLRETLGWRVPLDCRLLR